MNADPCGSGSTALVDIKENMKRKKKRGEKNRVNENRRKGVKKIYKIPVTICKENGDNV